MKHIAVVVALVSCGGSQSAEEHAVGTYIGGGSVIFGPDPCTYEAEPTVFAQNSRTPEKGPRFVYTTGRITQTCGESKSEYVAVVPTGAMIEGPSKIKAAAESDRFSANLVANGRELRGNAAIDWELGKDCEGLVRFGDVLGAQDTGGRDRTRTLVALGGTGRCTIIATLTTGSVLHEGFAPRAFQTQKLVTIQ